MIKESNAQLSSFSGPRILEKGNSEGYSFLSCYHVFFTPTLCGLEGLGNLLSEVSRSLAVSENPTEVS